MNLSKIIHRIPTYLALFTLLFSCKPEEDITGGRNELATETAQSDWSAMVAEAQRDVSSSSARHVGDDSLTTVQQVDVDRYTGRWYELARKITDRDSDGCECVSIDYAAIEGGISIFNNCFLAETGFSTSVSGQALVVEPETNAKLKVTFAGIPNFVGDYWIIDLVESGKDTPYQFAVVSDPQGEGLSILSRSPTVNTLREKRAVVLILVRLILKGFDLQNISVIPQRNECEYPPLPTEGV